ncbi:PAS domain S-box protein [Pedobacter cryoconitis]|uniref:histidine kinase n=1 Tax=Pedobacter cryoconitis TaxID=188932 RepID=A0A7X0MJF0_9SPHI|nr:PAS domain-containing protein [Pedobacter cryoconitis]MBB6500926.1 PAS domain S-box-containing protein [Pedobacter cryoconitis]
MRKRPLLKIIVFYLLVGITVLLIGHKLIGHTSATGSHPPHTLINTHIILDIILMITGSFIIFFSIRYYQKNHEATEFNYQKLFDTSPLAIYVMAKDSFKILSVNEAMTRLYGYSEQEFLQMTSFDIRPVEEHGRIREFMDQYGALDPESRIWIHQKKCGERFYVKTTFHTIPLIKNGAYLVMVVDIDKSIKDEKKINDLLQLYETVNHATNDVIWDYDVAGDELKWMQGYNETYGYDKEPNTDISGAMQKIHPDDRGLVMESFKNIFTDKQKYFFAEYRYRCADGAFKYIRDRGYAIFDQNGEPVRMIGAMQDIDKQKRYEQQLLSQNEQLKEIAWLNSHQVRRPLSNILGLISLIKNSGDHQEVTEFIDFLAVSSKELDDAVIMINKQTMEGKMGQLHKNMLN